MNLSDGAREERNAYLKQWRKKNPDKVKAMQERYWEKKSKQRLEKQNEGNAK